MWIFCFVYFCKRLKWPKGSEKGSPTELGQHIIPNFYLSVIRRRTTQMNWTKINSYGNIEVCSLPLQLLSHNCQILLLENFLLDLIPKNEVQIFFSFLNHEIMMHSDDLVFRILKLQREYSNMYDTRFTFNYDNWLSLNTIFKTYFD